MDVGCGHGLLLNGIAKRLKSGKAFGLDLWSNEDQAANSREATLRNAKLEGVASKVEIHDGDMRSMPSPIILLTPSCQVGLSTISMMSKNEKKLSPKLIVS